MIEMENSYITEDGNVSKTIPIPDADGKMHYINSNGEHEWYWNNFDRKLTFNKWCRTHGMRGVL